MNVSLSMTQLNAVLLLCIGNFAAVAQVVEIPDPVLEAAVPRALDDIR